MDRILGRRITLGNNNRKTGWKNEYIRIFKEWKWNPY
jgi:hypothetical protein